jgi:hypothetical protein
LATFTFLESLEINETIIDEFFIGAILHHLIPLKNLILIGIGNKITGKAFQFLEATNLEYIKIDLSHLDNANEFLTSLKNTGGVNKIKTVNIEIQSYSNSTWCDVIYSKNLKELAISFSHYKHQRLEHFCYIRELESLRLCEIRSEQDLFFNQMNFTKICKNGKNLKSLSLVSTKVNRVIKSYNLQEISQFMPKLIELKLSGFDLICCSKTKDDAGDFIKNILKIKKLQVLYLDRISSLLNQDLCEIIDCHKSLMELRVTNCPLIDDTILLSMIDKAENNTELQFKVCLDSNTNSESFKLPKNLNYNSIIVKQITNYLENF